LKSFLFFVKYIFLSSLPFGFICVSMEIAAEIELRHHGNRFLRDFAVWLLRDFAVWLHTFIMLMPRFALRRIIKERFSMMRKLAESNWDPCYCDPCPDRKLWKLTHARGSPGCRWPAERQAKRLQLEHPVHVAYVSGDELYRDSNGVIETSAWQYEKHNDKAFSVQATSVEAQREGMRTVGCGSDNCQEESASAEATAIERAAAAGPQLVETSVQCNLDDLSLPQSRPLLLRQHQKLMNVIAQQCLHCGALPGRDKQFCEFCADLPGLHAAMTAIDEVPRDKRMSEQPIRPPRVNQTRRPFRSTGTSLRPQEAKQFGDTALISRVVTFAGIDGRKLGDDGRLCLAEPVMCGRLCQAECY